MAGLQEPAARVAGPALKPVGAQQLIAVLAAMLRELRGGGDAAAPALDDDLEHTLGIDSLARMELMLRLEQAFGVRMPEELVQQAQTPRDLLRALAAAAPRKGLDAEPPAPAAPASAGREAPRHAATMIEVLEWHARNAPEHRHITLLGDDGATETLTHAELLVRARAVAAGLQRDGVAAGDSVALMLPTGLEFFAAFSGIVLAGGVPIPIYPPFRASQIEDHLRRQAQILDNGRAVLLVSDERALPAARILRAGATALRAVVTVEQLAAAGGTFAAAPRGAHDTALLQYTSGSTGRPKGVVLTHANLLANIRAMAEALATAPSDVFVSWLPLYHDMGLIGAWMGSLYVGMPLVLMAPQSFLARPARWLRAMHQHRGTLSAAPNFAYEILATKVPDDELRGLDLSSWRAAINGAEPVQAATLERFAERFAPHGFDATAMLPVYGLAENAVGLAFTPLGRGPKVDRIDRALLHAKGIARPLATDDARAMPVVSCGAALPGHQIRVVDALGAELPERVEGRVRFRGPSATSGYHHNAQATRELFHGDWLDTGDLGYLADGEIHLTSRVKDLIIRGGHNIHPYELEHAVGNLPGVRRGCVAVFGASDPESGTERIVVVAETRSSEAQARAALRQRIAELASALLGVPADDIVLADAHVVLKTSSGKIRRAACRELYERGLLHAPRRSLWRQLARLWLDAMLQRLRGPLRPLAGAAYAAWLWALFALGAVVASAIALLPVPRWRKRAARALARAVVRASLLPLSIEELEHVPSGPAVIVANHASYVDWLLLTAMLPTEAVFVAKRELAHHRALRWLLERAGTRFVTRDDVHQGVEDAKTLTQAARAGETLVFFPEGGLERTPGLRPFHMGAFVVSADSGLPLLPVSLRGTRSVLRVGSWWPRRHPVAIHVHDSLLPQGSDWRCAVQLRDEARRSIVSACGEAAVGSPELAMTPS